MLEEIGQPYEKKILSLDNEEHKTPEYLAINPMGRVPALRHGNQVITETAAIVMYLGEKFPEAGMSVPVSSPDYGNYLRWLFFSPVTAETAIVWKSLGEIKSEREYFVYICNRL